MIRKLIPVIAISMTLSACTSVSHQPLDAKLSQNLQGKSLVSTQYEKPDFSAMTAGKAAFAAIGAAAMISEGNDIVRENDIRDPAISIADGLLDKLKSARNMDIKQGGTVAKSDDIGALLSDYSGAEYLLDVKTFNWMFGYYPDDWSHYRVIYNARMRLIDAGTKKVIAETMCSSTQGDDKNPPTKDDLLKNGAQLLKEYLEKASTACVDVLSTQVLML